MHERWKSEGRGPGFVRRARNQNRKPRRMDVIMSDVGGDDWLTATLHRVQHNVSVDTAYDTMVRLETRNGRIGYYGRSIRGR